MKLWVEPSDATISMKHITVLLSCPTQQHPNREIYGASTVHGELICSDAGMGVVPGKAVGPGDLGAGACGAGGWASPWVW